MFRRFHEAIGSGDPDLIAKAIDELVALDVICNAPVPTGMTGLQAFTQIWDTILHAFPNLRVQIEELIAEVDKLACRNTVTGTLRGEYRGHRAHWQDRHLRRDVRRALRRRQDRRDLGVVDVFAQLRQLGALAV
ncbi:ester cyclase [Nonomuraea gerenzanensis]|uniref:SnoaL-like domain-containing protein n=1 Tax=Nonomuraea gerenzanensis TaxID=93944 RepID=A0A1M4EB31_9ACTN|nr:ester cyclase [Nonomuraea gerenzanensis]UBU18190.1 ester cyclase [Nonomuraea gerenzanensis]SBO96004.1 hypothetical protein BN4615_P5520 [Nonomuraea gerenzanensis]